MANFLSNTLSFMTRPIRDLVELGNITQKGLNVNRVQAPIFTQQELLDIANNGGSRAFMADPRSQQFQRDLRKSQSAYGQIQNYQPVALKPNEMPGLLNYDRALKDAAIAGSMMAPVVGAGLGGAVTGGILSGGLSGFGGSGKGQELGSTLGGMALGGALGAGGYGVMKAGSALFNKGKGGFKYNEFFGKNPKTLDDIGGPAEAKKSLALMDELFDDLGLPKNNKMQRAEGLAELRNIVGQGIGKIEETSKSTIGADDLTKMLEGSVDEFTEGQKGELLEVVKNLIAKNTDDMGMLSTKAVDNISDVVVEMAGGYEKLAGQGSQKIAANRIKEMLRKVLVGDAKAGIPGMAPELAPLKQIYNTIMKAKDPVYALASKGGQGIRFYGPEVGSEVLGNLFDTINRKSAEFGATAGKAVGAPGHLGNLLYGNAVKEAQKVGGIGTGVAGSGLLGKPFSGNFFKSINPVGTTNAAIVGSTVQGIQGGQQGGQQGVQSEQMQQQNQGTDMYIDPNTGFLVMPDMGQGEIGTSQQQQAYTIKDGMRDALRIMPGASEAQIMSLAKVLVDENTPKEPTKEELATNAALSIVDEIENMVGSIDLKDTDFGAATGGRLDKAYAAIVPSSQKGVFQTTRAGLVSRISRALGNVGTLSDKDIELAINLIPDLTDTPASAAEKVARLRAIISGAAATTGYGTNNELGNLGYGE